MSKFRIKQRRGTTADLSTWTEAPLDGEIIVEKCNNGQIKIKIGDGQHTFAQLPYLADTNGITKLNGIESGAQVNVIETIKVNGQAQTITSKIVDIDVPTKTSDITNDSNFAVDANYVHTDNNYTTAEKTKLAGVEENANNYVLPDDIATQGYVDGAIAALVESAPETLDTLNELAAALGDDPNFATTVSTEIGNKQDKLIAGSNISIASDGKTISATDTTYTAGNDISIVDNTINVSAGVVEVTGTSGTFTDEQAQLLSNSSLAYISLSGKRFNQSKVVVGRSGVVALYTSVVDSDLSSIEFSITSKEWVLRTTTLQSALTAGNNVQIADNVISATDTKYTAGTNITIDENNVISATGGASVDFDDKTIIKGTDNKYQTAIGGWKETTPEQSTELFVNTRSTGLPTYIASAECGWDYTQTITSLVGSATEAVIHAKFTALGTTIDNHFTLTKQETIPYVWSSDHFMVGSTDCVLKISDAYVGANNGGIGLIPSVDPTDLSNAVMESCALVTGAGSVIYHPIDNKFLKLDNSLAVDENNKLKVNTEVIQPKLTAGTNITIDNNNVISATGGGTADSVDWDNVQNKPESFTPASHTHNVVSKSSNGFVPQLPNEDTTTKYLRQDGTWQVPPTITLEEYTDNEIEGFWDSVFNPTT